MNFDDLDYHVNRKWHSPSCWRQRGWVETAIVQWLWFECLKGFMRGDIDEMPEMPK